MARLPQVNKLVDQKLSGNKTLNYINQNKNMYQKESNKMLPTATKLADVPILKRNIANKKISKPVKTNPTIERYKQFREEKKFKEEEKKFNEEFEADYGGRAMKNKMRAKENKNIREGKAPHEGFSSSDQIVAETTKDEAKEVLAAIKAEPKIVEPSYIDHMLTREDAGPKLSLKEHMDKAAPREIDELGITALDGVSSIVALASLVLANPLVS